MTRRLQAGLEQAFALLYIFTVTHWPAPVFAWSPTFHGSIGSPQTGQPLNLKSGRRTAGTRSRWWSCFHHMTNSAARFSLSASQRK